MIGQAGTGSPEVGTEAGAAPRVHVYTLRTGAREGSRGPRSHSFSRLHDSIDPWRFSL